MMNKFISFENAVTYAGQQFTNEVVHSDFWQGVPIASKPEMAMHEVLLYSFEVPMYGTSLDKYQQDIKPNLPWADIHFEQERVSGEPINPGESWKIWPYGHSASKFLDEKGQFNHSYAERYWPRYAARSVDGRIPFEEVKKYEGYINVLTDNPGIRGRLGDLNDVITLLEKDPLTRQAYLPVWFPEDTALPADARKPCTLGYHFIRRHHKFHIVYYIRSCDFIRHFRDDIYLTARLLLWVLEKLKQRDPKTWERVIPGNFVMHITSLHMFRNDYIGMKNANDKR